MPGNISVQIESFAERHFIKRFAKKYNKHWDMTLQAIVAELERIDTLLQTDRAEIICDAGDIKMIKTKFRIAGTQESAKSSGNRCIVAYHPKEHIAHILLAYTKTDIPTNHETATWQRLIKENYPRYKHLF